MTTPRPMRTRRWMVLLVAAVLAACTACTAGPGGSEGSGQDNVLNVHLYQKPKRFSPLDAFNGPDGLVMQLVFDTLFTVTPDYELKPQLAKSWEVSEDGTTYTFHLREGQKWSDGEPFDSADVLFTYRLLANPEVSSGMSGRLANVQGVTEFTEGTADSISGLRAPDENTFVIELTEPNLGFLSLLAIPYSSILPEHVLGDVPLDQLNDHEFFNNPTVGMGPYTFVQYKTDQFVEVKANPNFRTDVAVDRIFLKPVSSDVATAQLSTGEMDLVTSVSPTDLSAVQGIDGVQVDTRPSPGFVRMAINQTKDRFADPRVRQAMLYAIDRQAIVEQALQGQGSVQNSVFTGPLVPEGLNQYEYNPDKARRLLQEAGWDSDKPVGLMWVPGQRDRDTAATIVQSQLAEVGVKVELRQMQVTQTLEATENRTYDLSLFGGGNYAIDGSSVAPIISCDAWYPNSGNTTYFCDKRIDRLLAQAAGETDETRRTELYRQVGQRENQLVSYLWLYNPDTISAHSTTLAGFEPHGDFTLAFWNAGQWRITN